MSTAIDSKGLLQRFAELKGIPVSKVLRNAARDFVQAALRETPMAYLSRSPWARIKTRGGKTAYRRIDNFDGAARDRLAKQRIRIRRGWNRATWRGVMAALGMTQRNRPRSVPRAVDVRSGAVWSGTETAPEVTVVNRLALDKAYPGQIERIQAAGFALAVKRITREMNRILKK